MRELNCDVVVVGCGAAGLTAALAALQNGAKVIALERSTVEDRGGNTRWTEAMLRMTQDGDPSADFIKRFTERAGYHVTPEFVQATAADYNSWPALVKALPFTDPELLSTFVDGIPGVLEWLRRHGISIHTSIYPLPPAVRGDPWPGIQGGGLAIIEALFPEIEKLGARIEYETTAVRLLTDDDERVVGIKATDRNHAGVMIKARGVVLACGGFEGNPEMTVRYMGPEARYLRPVARGGWYNRGEGIRMALEANAAPAGDYAECHRQPIDPRSNRGESLVFAYPLGVLANARGQRFIDEAPNHVSGYLEEPLRALSRQPGGIAYFIFDRQIETHPTGVSWFARISRRSKRHHCENWPRGSEYPRIRSKRRSPASIAHVHRAPGTQASSTARAPAHSCRQNPTGRGQSPSHRSAAIRSSRPTPLRSAG